MFIVPASRISFFRLLAWTNIKTSCLSLNLASSCGLDKPPGSQPADGRQIPFRHQPNANLLFLLCKLLPIFVFLLNTFYRLFFVFPVRFLVMRWLLLVFILVLVQSGPLLAYTQTEADTTTQLEAVRVHAYFGEQDVLRVPASVATVSRAMLNQQSGTTLLPAINAVPGVRMEERSPGSYRLSIRGSLLRSPFGVRNVKVYFDEIPLTDAGGNTYLNLLDAGSIDRMEVLKGPDGSLFGANTGGVVRLHPQGLSGRSTGASLRINGGSYGLFHQQASLSLQPHPNYGLHISQGHQQAAGYRENSAMRRDFVQLSQRWEYHPDRELRVLAMYSDMQYRTPGGLTEQQFLEFPAGARPATSTIPGALEQQAGIYNKTGIGGLVHDMKITGQLRHVASVFGLLTDFRNPFITNYEIRKEHNYGFRTYLDYRGDRQTGIQWQANLGVEWQQGAADIRNYDNHGGERGAPQAFDKLRNAQHFYFARLHALVDDKFLVESAVSLNAYSYRFREMYPDEEGSFSSRRFSPQWMPRLGVAYLPSTDIALRASVSRGYSPPTTAEVRSSDNIINTDLRAEMGWNYETGLRWQSNDLRFYADASVFYYKMEDAIIRQLRDSGAEYFANAGGVNQRGLELAANAWVMPPGSQRILRGLQLGTNLTWSRFRFAHYVSGGQDFGGNRLTGVPSTVLVSHARFLFPARLSLFVMHNYTSDIPLNDANTVYADAYHLVHAKANWQAVTSGRWTIDLFAGVDNLLDQTYSLGNDINAFGGRFFNAAPGVNFYGGLVVSY